MLNAALGWLQEAKAAQAVAALARMTTATSAVLRAGAVVRVPSTELVTGDVLVLAEGDAVGAVARLAHAAALVLLEAPLTGESEPVRKVAAVLPEPRGARRPATGDRRPATGDRRNMVFKGTAVAQGTGRAIRLTLKDERVRAIVAMSSLAVLLTAESLASVRPATLIYAAQLDRFVVPRFHAEWVATNLIAANLNRVPNAWHFAFMDTPSISLPSPDGDVAANPPSFYRDAFLKQLGIEIVAFFDKTLL